MILMNFLRLCFSCTGLRYRVWTTDPREELPIKMGTEGAAAKQPLTVYDRFKKTVENHGDEPALRFQDLSMVITVDQGCEILQVIHDVFRARRFWKFTLLHMEYSSAPESCAIEKISPRCVSIGRLCGQYRMVFS